MFLHVQDPGGGDLITNGTKATHPHAVTELCGEGGRLYAIALRTGRIARADVESAPCLMEFALLHPDPDDANWLRPVPPSAALAQRLNAIEREITERRRMSIELADAFEPFMTLSAQAAATTHSITVLEGNDRINAALDLATAQCQTEMLTVQPSGPRPERNLIQGLERDRPLIERGVRIRTLYQHTARYSPEKLAYVDQLSNGKVEHRTIDELVERLIICDETVAFIPTRDDQKVALELRHPGLVRYLIKVFEFMWGRSVPLSAGAPYENRPGRHHGHPALHRETPRGGPRGRGHSPPPRHERPHLPCPHRQAGLRPRQRKPCSTRFPDSPVGAPGPGSLNAERTEPQVTTGAHEHGAEELCQAGLDLYPRALHEGRVTQLEAEPVPCLIDFGLLQPDIEDMRWLHPVAPAVALPRLLRNTADAITQQRQREARLAEAFEPLMRIDGPHAATAETPTISVLSGLQRINSVITQTMASAHEELLTIQPHNGRNAASVRESLERDQALLDRGARIRTLYQHTLRHSPAVVARYELLKGDIAVRTLDEVTERLIIIDRAVAFIPANKDRTLALEVRNPALITFFVITFERLWRLAMPMYPEAAQQPTLNGITPASEPSRASSSKATPTPP